MNLHKFARYLSIPVLFTSNVLAQQGVMRAVADTLAVDIATSGKKAIAVVDFTDLDGNATELGRYLAEELSVALVQTHKTFTVIERTHLKAILDEHKLTSTGLINASTAQKIGQFTGAECVITGTMTPFAETVRIAVKVITTNTAAIVAADSIDLPRTQTISQLLAQGDREKPSVSGNSKATRKDGGIPPRPPLVAIQELPPPLVQPDTPLTGNSTASARVDDQQAVNGGVTELTRTQSCQPTYSKPIFNPYPITWGLAAGANCMDFAILAGGIRGKSQWMNEFSAHAGDEVRLRIYINNGAADNSRSVMHNVRVATSIDPESGWVVTTLSASNADPATGSVHIKLEPGNRLKLVDGDPSPKVGDLPPHFSSAKLFYFTLRVVSQDADPTSSRLGAGQPAVVDTKRVGQLEVALKTCRSQPEGILCEALITNLGADRQYCLVSKADTMMSRLVDERGVVSTPIRIALAENNGPHQMWVCANLPSRVPVLSSLLFATKPNPSGLQRIDGPDTTARLQMVEFGFDIVNYASRSPTSFFIQFRGVPLSR